MKRINTVNARPDVNGIGKAGFHNNADVSGQDATYLDPSWCNHVQEEIAAVVEEHEPLDPNNKNQLKIALYALFATNDSLQEVDDRLTAAITALASAIQPFLVRTGTIETWATNVCPTGYLECSGQAISRTTYADLFNVLGTSFGVGDGSTTFNLPDLRGEFIRGWDHGRGIDAGRALGSYQKATSVFMGDPSLSYGAIANLYNTLDDNPQTFRTALNGEATTLDDTNMTVLSSPAAAQDPISAVDGSMSVRPRNIALMFIIKT
ncbi:phage tail protein [Acinetobacter beijerinckii]|uniref:phage tail protein n=1 Tax=Acinetobacter beijerinckii TaxID=262668 RepID=UPI003AF87A6E